VLQGQKNIDFWLKTLQVKSWQKGLTICAGFVIMALLLNILLSNMDGYLSRVFLVFGG